jgi:virginiamycin B lyase
VITEFPVTNVFDLTAGPDGNVWFTDIQTSSIGRITPTGVVTEFPLPAPDSGPFMIATGPDGNLWFTLQGEAEIASITP